MAFSPYDRDETVHRHRLKLPHWRQWGRTYFVTTRLADSLPSSLRDEWIAQRSSWLAQHGANPEAGPDDLPETERTEFHRKFTARFHELLDAGHGSCCLARNEVAGILIELFLGGLGKDYELDAWVIMPNHFHVIVGPSEGRTLGGIVKRWKGSSARRINQALDQSGSLWQAEAFDHIVRSEKQLNHFRRYIAENPSKAGLREGYVLGRGERFGIAPEEVMET